MAQKIFIVGFGPGHREHITERARQAMVESEVILGYNTYVDLVKELLTDQVIVRTGMTEEVSRAQKAVELARGGQTVAVVSSGDAGVYGMAGLIYEVLLEQGWHPSEPPEVEVVPGISAINSCASLLGAPIMHDACTISLSDHLTPWAVIERRLEAAASADFVIALYNPKSGRRTRQIAEAQRILLKHRSPETPVGLVKSAYRDRQTVVRTDLAHMLDYEIGMLTTVIVGNSATFMHDDLMITPRGYQRKYQLDTVEQALRPGERLHVENEPWSLRAKETTGAPMHWTNDTLAQADVRVREVGASSARDLAEEALTCILAAQDPDATATGPEFEPGSGMGAAGSPTLLEVALSPGVANKKFTPGQLTGLTEIVGETGELQYTTAHQLVLRVLTTQPKQLVEQLRQLGFWVFPVGNVVKIKACDFCDGDKAEGIPFAEDLTTRIGGLPVPKELCIGYNGCAMSCYGAVHEDIALVFRKGKVDLFLGGKTTGRNAQPARRVAEGIPAKEAVDLVEQIVRDYQRDAFPDERFHKYFKRVGSVAGFQYQETAPLPAADAVCGV
ncbi:precorrin-3B C(17)-methyltransferase [Alicyclobacillus sp. ALC3]|uniref:precorrin-3B C(17)-methyltransferase n=1 Tax=Alicyclobacillus sp. ALC3 TaxID=2796143 RepID=UPI0023784C55|nr:precorrin-3B C(17)-methyltransferase [Alicyclobacillus sp. ALC3]WDL96520.1 precorrin-3B C(17)-methyltransferase [Alicyclobacillus sp. ALC3]